MARRVVFLFVLASLLFLVSLFVGGGVDSSVGVGDVGFGRGVGVVYFYGESCPHCARVKPLIDELEQEYKIDIRRFEVFGDRDNLRLLNEYFERYDVPVTTLLLI